MWPQLTGGVGLDVLQRSLPTPTSKCMQHKQPHSNTATKDIVSVPPGGIVLPRVTLQLQRDRKRKIKARSAYRTKVQSKCCVALREEDLLREEAGCSFLLK